MSHVRTCGESEACYAWAYPNLLGPSTKENKESTPDPLTECGAPHPIAHRKELRQ